MRIKICGITQFADAKLAMQLGAWGLGFIFYPKSPRCIEAKAVRQILNDLDQLGLRPERSVGVFVNAELSELQNIVNVSGINTVQLHGDESPAYCAAIEGLEVWKALRLSGSQLPPDLVAYEAVVQVLLFDAAVPGQYGGTGQLADWSLVSRLQCSRPVILSGGLHAENIQSAAAEVQAFAYDLSSGVELQPGRKDPAKLLQLFKQGVD